MERLFQNPVLIFWTAVVAMSIIPAGFAFWSKTRRAEIDAQLKVTMLEMGMSAADIERVLQAESGASVKKMIASRTEQA